MIEPLDSDGSNLADPFISETSSDAVHSKFEQAVKLYMKGVNGDAASVLEAKLLFEELRNDKPGDPLVDAYYGSSLILIARDQPKPLSKLRWANQGLKILDGAVAANPRDLTIRLLRGKNASKLPEHHFHRTQTMIEDYNFIIQQQLLGNAFLTPQEYSQLLYDLGEAYVRVGRREDAATTWRNLEAQTNNLEMKQLLQNKLQSLGNKPVQETKTESSPLLMLIDVTRTVGNSLVDWSNEREKQRRKTANRNRKVEQEELKKQETKKEEIKKQEIKKPAIKRPEVKKEESKKQDSKQPVSKKPEVKKPEVNKREIIPPEVRKQIIQKPGITIKVTRPAKPKAKK